MNNNLKTAILLSIVLFLLIIVLYNLFFQNSFEGFEIYLDNSGNIQNEEKSKTEQLMHPTKK
jgi:uncharacterized membrane protein YvbJ